MVSVAGARCSNWVRFIPEIVASPSTCEYLRWFAIAGICRPLFPVQQVLVAL